MTKPPLPINIGQYTEEYITSARTLHRTMLIAAAAFVVGLVGSLAYLLLTRA